MPPLAQYRSAVIGGFLLFAMLVLALTTLTIIQTRDAATQAGFRLVAVYVQQFEDLITQSGNTAIAAASNVPITSLSQGDLTAIEDNFRRILRQAPFIRSLSIVDESQRTIASSSSANLGKVIDTSGFYPEASGDSSFVRVGRPWAGRDFSDGKESSPQSPIEPGSLTFIPVAVTIAAAGKRVTLVIALNPEHFATRFSNSLSADIGSSESITKGTG